MYWRGGGPNFWVDNLWFFSVEKDGFSPPCGQLSTVKPVSAITAVNAEVKKATVICTCAGGDGQHCHVHLQTPTEIG